MLRPFTPEQPSIQDHQDDSTRSSHIFQNSEKSAIQGNLTAVVMLLPATYFFKIDHSLNPKI